MHSKVSSDWLPSYIKATLLVLEIFKMAGYFPDSPRTCRYSARRNLLLHISTLRRYSGIVAKVCVCACVCPYYQNEDGHDEEESLVRIGIRK